MEGRGDIVFPKHMIVSNADIDRRMTPSNSEERMDALGDRQTASVARMRERFAIVVILPSSAA
jgi:hypothetical protein